MCPTKGAKDVDDTPNKKAGKTGELKCLHPHKLLTRMVSEWVF